MTPPVLQPRLARRLREGGPNGRDDAEPHPQERVVDPVETPLAGAGLAAKRRLPAHQAHLGERRQWTRQTGGGGTEPTRQLADPVRAAANDVQQRAQRRRRRGLLQQQSVRLRVQRAGRVEHQRVDRSLNVETERLGELPVARHPAPQGVERRELLRLDAGERVREVPRLERAQGERFPRAAVEGSVGCEDGAVHHPPTRTAHDESGPAGRGVDPRLQHAGQRRVGRDQVRQLVQHERPRPAAPLRLASGAAGTSASPGTRRRRSPVNRRSTAVARYRRCTAGADGSAAAYRPPWRRDHSMRRRVFPTRRRPQTTARAPGWPSTPSRRRISSARSMKCTHYYAAQHYVRMRHNIGRRAGRVREDSHPPTQ